MQNRDLLEIFRLAELVFNRRVVRTKAGFFTSEELTRQGPTIEEIDLISQKQVADRKKCSND